MFLNKLHQRTKQSGFVLSLLLIVCGLSIQIAHAQVVLPDTIERIAWNPEGTRIAIVGGSRGCDPARIDEYTVRILDPTLNQIVDRFYGHTCRLVDVSWSPDGTRIASSSFDSHMWIWDAASGNRIGSTKLRPLIGGSVMWSPDSSRIASIFGGGSSGTIWSATTGEIIITLLPYHDQLTSSLDWSSTGEIATGGLDGSIYIWDTAYQLSHQMNYSTSVYWVDWNPDGDLLASANKDGTVAIWNPATQELLTTFQVFAGFAGMVLWSPDGERLAISGDDGTIRIWSVALEEELEVIQLASGDLADMAWNPVDSSQLAYVSENSVTVEVVNTTLSGVSCDLTIPASDTTTLLSAITTSTGAGSPQTLCLTSSTYTFNAAPDITGDITIIGNGATIIIEAGSGFEVAGDGTLRLEHVTVIRGDDGGG